LSELIVGVISVSKLNVIQIFYYTIGLVFASVVIGWVEASVLNIEPISIE
jgi:hypothetical protein